MTVETSHSTVRPAPDLTDAGASGRRIPYLVIPPHVSGPTNRAHAGNVADPLRTANSDGTTFILNGVNQPVTVESIEN